MALVLADRVQETSTSPGGTGTLNLSGTAPVGFKTFSSGIGTGNSTYYCIFDTTAYDWEVGIGTYTSGSPGTLSRTTVLSNSAGTTSAINFTNGNTLNIFVTYPSEKSVNQDSSGAVNILTNVPNTSTTVGTLNVGDGTYSFSQLGQLATFASAEPVVNTVTVQNTSTSNTAYSSVQIGADNYNNGYFIELGTNSSTYSYSAAGYPNSSLNQPNTNYILANKADLGIATWDNKNIHFIQNASTTTTDSMTLYASGGVSLGGNPDPGLGALYANNVYLGFNQITAAAGTTVLTNASAAWQQVVGTTTQTIQLPNATTLYKGLAFTITNSSTGSVTIKDNASTTLDTVVTGGSAVMVLTANGTSAGTWVAYSYVPSSYDFSTSTANFGSAAITNAVWNGTTVGTGYGGTGLTSFTSGGALYATSGSALTSGTLPVTAGGTGQTSFSSGYIPYGNSSAALQSSSLLQFNGSYLQVGGGSTLGGTTNPIAAFTQSANGYVQTYIYNASTGGSGSSDFVAYTDNSTDAHGWADMGFTSSTYNDTSYSVTGPNEAYILGSAPSGAGKTGNLVYATDSTGSANAHQWYVGGFNQAKGAWKMQLTSTGLQLANALAVSYGGTGLTSTPANGALDIGNGTGFTRTTLTAGSGVTISNGSGSITISATGSGGTVTSVTGTSPVVSSGGNTPAISLASGYGDTQNPYASKTANYFLAAPNGSAGAPTFRAIVAADIPTLNQNTTGTAGGLTGTPNISVGTVSATGSITSSGTGTASLNSTGDIYAYRSGGTTGVIFLNSAGNRYLYWDGTNYNMPGGNVVANGTTLTGNTGTVTSVAASAGSGISISGSPITTSGTLTITNTGVTSVNGSTGAVTVSGGQYFGTAATKAIAYNANSISENITVTAGNNGLSAGPITINTGYTVTVETGAAWVIV